MAYHAAQFLCCNYLFFQDRVKRQTRDKINSTSTGIRCFYRSCYPQFLCILAVRYQQTLPWGFAFRSIAAVVVICISMLAIAPRRETFPAPQ